MNNKDKLINKEKLIYFSKFVFIILFLLTIFKIDYRFIETIKCCSDDFDYFMHASTIALDFDLDYSNQFDGQVSYNKYGKQTPVGFIGAGILSSPFLFLGNLLSNMITEDTNELMGYDIFLYSISSLIYFFTAYVLLYKIIKLYKIEVQKVSLFIIFLGSGVPYFAFERYSMTHVYEVFNFVLLFYLLSLYYFSEKDSIKSILISFFIPVVFLITYLTRMSNFYIILIPLIVREVFYSSTGNVPKKIINNKYFLLSASGVFMYYLYLSNRLYGKFIYNPQDIYITTEIDINNLIVGKNILDIAIDFINSIFIILFSFEFGLIWTSPILFYGILLANYLLIKRRDRLSIANLICFIFCIGVIHVWQSTASSYGYRYLYSLIPLATIFFYLFNENKHIYRLIIFMSIFSIICFLFFESHPLTQLSTEYQNNSFGKNLKYAQPLYVKGVIQAILSLNSYLIIFSTSFLGSIVFKAFLVIFGQSKFLSLLTNLGLPTSNNDFLNLINNLNQINSFKLFLIILIFTFFSRYLLIKDKRN